MIRSKAEIADILLPFCEAASITHKEPTHALKKRIIVSLDTFINNQALHQRLYGANAHIEWDHVHSYLSSASPSVQDWMHLLSLIDFIEPPAIRDCVLEVIRPTMPATATLPPASSNATRQSFTPMESMRICMARAHVEPPPSWDTLCKAFLICNISDLDASVAMNILLHSSASPSRLVTDILSQLSTFRHTPEDYENDIAYILDSGRSRVREHHIVQSIERVEGHAAALRQSARAVFKTHQRPSLTKMLQAMRLGEGGKEQLNDEDKLAGFCKKARMPANSNYRVRLIAYFLACLPDTAGNRADMMCRLLGCSPATGNTVASITVVTPDISALREAVMGTKHAGAPFDDLRRFSDSCVSASMLNGNALMWSAVLQLYMASYCRPSIAKDLHGLITGHYASFSGRDVSWLQSTGTAEVESRLQCFIRQWPMALPAVVDLMIQS